MNIVSLPGILHIYLWSMSTAQRDVTCKEKLLICALGVQIMKLLNM